MVCGGTVPNVSIWGVSIVCTRHGIGLGERPPTEPSESSVQIRHLSMGACLRGSVNRSRMENCLVG